MTAIYHTHASSWVILIILFLVSLFMTNNKIPHMILRLFYLVMIFTGGYMLFVQGGYNPAFHLKALCAILLIGMMEMVLVRRKKGKSFMPFLIALIVLLVVVVLIGYDVIAF